MRSRSLTTTFLVMVGSAMLLVATAFAWVLIRQDSDSRASRRLSDVLRSTLDLNQRFRADIDAQAAVVYLFLAAPDPYLKRQYETIHSELGRNELEYLKMDIGDQERLYVERIRDLQEELARSGSIAMEAMDSGDVRDALRHLARMAQLQSEINGVFEQLSSLEAEELDVALSRAEGTTQLTYAALLGILGVIATLLAVMGFLLRRRVQRPLAALLDAAHRVRGGDLAARAAGEGSDEVGRAIREFNYMARSLQDSYTGLENKVEERTAEIRSLQEQLVASERLSAIGQLVSGVAHELNNPLTTILGFAEVEREARARDEHAGSDVAVTAGALDEIAHQAERCRRIVADLLQFARQRETELANIDLNDIVERTVRLREYEVKTQGIELVRDYPDGVLVVRADPYKLEQVTLILVNNSVDAIRESAESGVIYVSIHSDGDGAVLEVRDTGGGFEEPQRAFEPFYTTKEVGKGTGLGLSVAYGIVSDHGGAIRGENWAEGARVVVTLPLAPDQTDVQAAPAAVEIEDAASRMSGRLLVVDDEPSLLRLQERVARSMGLDVETVESGEHAIECLQAGSFDAVVCDLRMPGLDGRGVYAWVLDHSPDLATHFAFTSGDLIQPGDAGNDLPGRFIRKPFTPAEYRQAIGELLQERRA